MTVIDPAAPVVAAPVEPATPVADPVVTPEPPVETFKAINLDSQDAADNFVKDRVARATRAAQNAAKAEKDALEARIAEFEAASLTADEKKDARIAAAEKLAEERGATITKLERKELVSELAGEAKLPKKLWDRVRGDTEEEIAADIAELMDGEPTTPVVPAEPVKGVPPTRTPKVKLQPTGAVTDPGINADDILKTLTRSGLAF